MKEYPSIPKFCPKFLDRPCIAFEKLDGSNIRVKWSAKKGWHLFGTRYRLFDQKDTEFGIAIEIWNNKYADVVSSIIHKEKLFNGIKEVICYCEFLGPNSFGGQHDIFHPALQIAGATHNDPKDLILFDVNIYKKGLISPQDFINLFSCTHITKVIYNGILDISFVNDVKEDKYPVVEGVVVKGGKGHDLWMTKIKSLSYLKELKRRFAVDWEKYV